MVYSMWRTGAPPKLNALAVRVPVPAIMIAIAFPDAHPRLSDDLLHDRREVRGPLRHTGRTDRSPHRRRPRHRRRRIRTRRHVRRRRRERRRIQRLLTPHRQRRRRRTRLGFIHGELHIGVRDHRTSRDRHPDEPQPHRLHQCLVDRQLEITARQIDRTVRVVLLRIIGHRRDRHVQRRRRPTRAVHRDLDVVGGRRAASRRRSGGARTPRRW